MKGKRPAREGKAPAGLPITIPEDAVRELDEVGGMGLGFTMPELVDWVNRAVERFYPEANEGRDRRVSGSFTVRTLRHYQTLGCLDAPEKRGRRAVYGFRHYLQALLIRKLLFLRYSPGRIRKALEGKSDRQYKEMLFSDIRIAKRTGEAPDFDDAAARPACPRSEEWTRIVLTGEAELHLKSTPRRMTPAGRRRLLELVEQQLKEHNRKRS